MFFNLFPEQTLSLSASTSQNSPASAARAETLYGALGTRLGVFRFPDKDILVISTKHIIASRVKGTLNIRRMSHHLSRDKKPEFWDGKGVTADVRQPSTNLCE